MAYMCQGCSAEGESWPGQCPACGSKLYLTLAPKKAGLIGQVLNDKYRIESKLGQGGMGTVYKAIREGVGQTVAIKVLNPEFSNEPEVVKRFWREVKTYGAIQHPNAVLKLGEVVKAQVLELDVAKRRLRLGMKQLIPTPLELFMAAHQEGEELSGRVVKAYPGRVQLDEDIEAACPSAAAPVRKIEEGTLAAKLAAVWKSNAPAVAEPEPTGVTLKSGEVRKFRLTVLDPARHRIEVEPV